MEPKTDWWESQSKGVKATIVIASLVFVFCIVNILRPVRRTEQPPSKPAITTPQKSTIYNLTLWKYNAITVDMKQDEVERIIGSKGTQIFDSSDKTGSMTSYTWKEGEAATTRMIQITFINKKVHDKTQFGLE